MMSLARRVARKTAKQVTKYLLTTGLSRRLIGRAEQTIRELQRIDAVSQLNLVLQYQRLLHDHQQLPAFGDIEFRNFSQNGEDGIILFLLSVVGITSRRCIEICAGDGVECNTANLIINHGFEGLLVDGNSDNISRCRRFYTAHPATRIWPPIIVQEWVTRENVNDIITRHKFDGEIDLLSLDLDGMDYWVWEAMDAVTPRVVVAEFNNLWPAEASMTVPYDPRFVGQLGPQGLDYGGASLGAFVKLAQRKGYRLVGCQRYGFNAFFVRQDVGQDELPEVDLHTCLTHSSIRYAIEVRQERVRDKRWIEV